MVHSYNGLFISFEGGEGSGKDTQVKLLENYLKRNGYSVEVGREPGGVPIGEEIRKLLLSPTYNKTGLTQVLLFEASRAEFVQHRLIPALKQGSIFIANRFYDSTTVYQGYAGSEDIILINLLNKRVSKGLSPDLTFILDLPVDIGLTRARNAKQEFGKTDWFESQNKKYHNEVRRGFLTIANNGESVEIKPEETITDYCKKKDVFGVKSRFKVVDVAKSIEECHNEIIIYVEDLLKQSHT